MAITKKNNGSLTKNMADLLSGLKEQAATTEEQVEALQTQKQALNTVLSNAKISIKFFTDEQSNVPDGRIIVQQQGQEDQSFSFDSAGGEDPVFLGSVQIIPGLEASITLDFAEPRIQSMSESTFSNQDGDVSSQTVSYSGGSPTWSATFHSAGRVGVYQR
jgi:hypothetical protein